MPSALAALCVATMPLFIPLLMWWLADGHRPSARTATALGAAFGGVALLVAVQGAQGGLSVWQATLLVWTALSWGLGAVLTRLVPLPNSPLAAAGAPLLAGGVALAAIAVLSGELSGFGDVSARSVGGLLYLILFGTVLTFGAYIWLLRVVSPSRVGTHAFVNPVVAVLLGWLLAGEAISAGTLGATAVIVVAVAVVILDREPAAPAVEDTPPDPRSLLPAAGTTPTRRG